MVSYFLLQRNFKPPKSRRKTMQKPRPGSEELQIGSPAAAYSNGLS